MNVLTTEEKMLSLCVGGGETNKQKKKLCATFDSLIKDP